MIHQHTSLLPYNTFGIDARAAFFTEICSIQELQTALQAGIQPVMILGGGSNMLLTKDVSGLVIKNSISGINLAGSDAEKTFIKVGGGVVWHDFVCWAVENGYGGVENLSLIPGTVGASPVQNIGAYGVELKDVFVELEGVELATGQVHTFGHAACRFGYRDSVFKQELKGKYCITSVTFALTHHAHRLNISYGDIQKTLESNGVTEPTIADVSRAVIQIRSSKLPDPAKIGNCGSFFKNPETSRTVLERIRLSHPQVVSYDLPDGRVKIPAGWLIEQCGWKGEKVGNTGCYEKQALVLVNYGGATGAEVKNLAYAIIDSVEKTFGIRLEPEVNII
ncbi:MAG: UDP-N-acetylmuramate dehydrogenase [Saprospiraceae bacterium]|nr:UDP-N-acetylmuramate dehydrogenase [Saprospiraceae bacterium]